jgi:hypothetical protein
LSLLVANIQARELVVKSTLLRRTEGEAKRGEGDNDGLDTNNAKALDLV